jgi:hypothetical protein
MSRRMESGSGTAFDDKFLDSLNKTLEMPVPRRVCNSSNYNMKSKGRGKNSAGKAGRMNANSSSSSGSVSAKQAGLEARKKVVENMSMIGDDQVKDKTRNSGMRQKLYESEYDDFIHHTYLPSHTTTVRSTHTLNKSYTASSWSKSERERLNHIYWELERPRNNNYTLQPWREYYTNFASKFITYFPQRSMQEIREKVQYMITNRVFKEKGENEYWSNQGNENKLSALIERGTNMGRSKRFDN